MIAPSDIAFFSLLTTNLLLAAAYKTKSSIIVSQFQFLVFACSETSFSCIRPDIVLLFPMTARLLLLPQCDLERNAKPVLFFSLVHNCSVRHVQSKCFVHSPMHFIAGSAMAKLFIIPLLYAIFFLMWCVVFTFLNFVPLHFFDGYYDCAVVLRPLTLLQDSVFNG